MTPGFPAGDTVSGIFGALSIMIAVYHRDVNDGSGQMIDLGLYESLFRMLEFSAIAYDQNEEVMQRNGNTHTYVAPSSTYETKDSEYISFTASTESVWQRLTDAMGKPELAEDTRFKDHKARVENSDEINGIVREWVSRRTSGEIEDIFNEHGIPFSFTYDIQDAFQDEHYQERENLVRVPDDELGEMVVQNTVPKMSETPGGIDHLGPEQGAHNEEVYGEMLGYDEDMLSELRESDVI
jgi:formyl-CoA transferase